MQPSSPDQTTSLNTTGSQSAPMYWMARVSRNLFRVFNYQTPLLKEYKVLKFYRKLRHVCDIGKNQ